MVRRRFSSPFGSRRAPRFQKPPLQPPPPPSATTLESTPLVDDMGASATPTESLIPVPPGSGGGGAGGVGGGGGGGGDQAGGTPPERDPAAQAPHAQRQRRRRVTLPRVTRGWSRAIVWSLIGITTGGILYGFLARIETSVGGMGQLVPIGGVGSVTPPFTGIVDAVLVKEGQMVRKGQPILRLRDLSSQAQLQDLLTIQNLWRQETQVIASQLGFSPPPGDPVALEQLLASTNEVGIRRAAASAELARSRAEMESTRSDVEGLTSQLRLNQSITARLERLRNQGAASQLDLDRQREREQSIRTTLNRAAHELESAKLRVQETTLKGSLVTAADRKELFPRYSNARQQYIEASTKITDLRERIKLQTLQAPTTGKVFDLQAKPGETISSNRPAVRIVPPNALEARMEISNKDIGLIRPGMKVDLRIDSFPSTEYGSIKAWITRIGADAVPPTQSNPQPHFVITARLSDQFLKRHDVRYRLRPGMAFNGLIILDSRPAISLITDRLFSFMESSRTIR